MRAYEHFFRRLRPLIIETPFDGRLGHIADGADAAHATAALQCNAGQYARV